MQINDPKAFAFTDIAIIGISARFPGAANYNIFWDNLLKNIESICFFDNQVSENNFVNAKPFIENSDFFDANFFDISSREAALMDPQHRLLLQSAWHAFEDAGYMPKEVPGRVGVFATSNFNTYQHVNGWFSHYWKKVQKKSSARFLAYTGNIQDTLATRISYKLNLTGPSVTVQTACSSSLVAMHLGCQSLLMGESDVVLVGASALSFPDREGYYYESGMILSSDGHCRAFDKDANGTIFGNGVSCVILKPLDQARLDNDYIYAVIKGSAINNDGSRKVDFNAPSTIGQEEVIRQAHELSGVHPETISYVEAHGTGTTVGDPIEFSALCNAFRSQTDKQQFCGIGSVKTNIGHLDAASGFAGFIKTILALDRQIIPSTIHYREQNENLELDTSPFYVVDKEKPFKASSDLRRCAVTSLGIGGTNAHFILQEAPRLEKKMALDSHYNGPFPFLISAHTQEQLHHYLASLLNHIQTHRNTIFLSDIIYTLATSRIRKRNRCLGFFNTLVELEDALNNYLSKGSSLLKFFESNEETDHTIIEDLPAQIPQVLKECVQDWILGNKMSQHMFFDEFEKARIPLPGYPFFERRYWYDQIEGLEHLEQIQTSQSNFSDELLVPPLNQVGETPEKMQEDQLLCLEKYFLTWFAKATNNPRDFIKLDIPLENYNIDSVLAIALSEQMCDVFGPVSKTLFFEHYTLRDVLDSIQKTCNKVFMDDSLLDKKGDFKTNHCTYNNRKGFESEIEVAIVGVSGYYPFSNTLEELWNNLIQGRNLITEIPKERWDHSLYYSEEIGSLGKTYSKWGGFIDNLYLFDPLFFKISPREAALLDPQERLFLQIAWITLEDAGYTPNAINLKTDHNIGVYVGASYQEYQFYGIEERFKQNPVIINGQIASIANRASYFLDFRGPSLSVDTMCSSSLTALNLAYQDLVLGKVKAALVGGVNITAHPNKYLQLAQERMLSKDGLCKSFGPNGSGYVPSEGIGCVLIKSLADAEKDHDHIYGVIRGIDINHGGKSNGFTVPNTQAQANVIKKALAKSEVSPCRVSYIEAHGTGTALGDPIEVQGLTLAYASEKKQFCSIGSIKSNMGHAEAAAGIAGLTKILLQFKHRKLVPSIHSETLNPHIHFENTPFKVQRKMEDWKSSEGPLVAGLSSFGAGGSNAHLIVEEYCSNRAIQSENPSRYLIVLSAKNQERLEAYAKTIATFIQRGHAEGAHLADIAFTLAVGRESMSYRAACICESKLEFVAFLTSIYTGEIANHSCMTAVLEPVNINAEHVKDAIDKGNLFFIKEAWLKGGEIEWSRLFERMDNHPKRISLPTYPFEKKNCKYPVAPIAHFGLTPSILHPFIHENISNLEEVRFKSHFNDQFPTIMDHKIHQKVVYPGAGYIEMALFVCRHTLNLQGVLSLSHISFLKPFYLSQINESIYTSLVSQSSGSGIEIWGINQEKEQIYFQTKIDEENGEEKENDFLFESNNYSNFYDSEACYRKFNEYNFNYGPLYQTIKTIAVDNQEALVQAQLNSEENLSSFIIHPVLLDAAFQSTIAFDFSNSIEYLYVPKEIESMRVYDSLSHEVLIHIVKKTDHHTSERLYDIKIFNQQKKLCVAIENFKEMPLLQNVHSKKDCSDDVVYFTKRWKAQEATFDHELKQKKRFLWISSSFASLLKNCFNEELTVFSDDNECIIHHTISYFNSLKQHLHKDKNKEPTQFICVFPESKFWISAPLVGLFKVLKIEQPNMLGKVLLLPDAGMDETKILQIIEKETHCHEHYVRYDMNDQRFIEDYEEVFNFPSTHHIPLIRHNGVYILLGGGGGIGQNCIHFFGSKKIPCKLIITGRKSSSPIDLSSFPKEVSVYYIPCDVSDQEAVIQLVEYVTATYGAINGVFHLAGVIRDSFLIRKTESDLKAVLKPKIEGLINIDFATRNHSLDYLILFSSDSSVYGNIGQSDYCAANAFLDEFAYYREQLKMQGLRHGLTKVINWPYWENGGMKLEQAILDRLYTEEGVVPLKTEIAFSALEKIFNSSYIQIVALEGNRQKILQHFHHTFQKQKESVVEPTWIDASIKNKVSEYLKNHLSRELKIETHLLKPDSFFDDFGIDSILSMNIISSLEKKFGQLPKTLFFQYSTFSSFVDYFLNHHLPVFSQNESILNQRIQIPNESKPAAVVRSTPFSIRQKNVKKEKEKNTTSIDVAIIGIAGRYPQADTLDELWNHLIQGKNCIEEIPHDRFDYHSIFLENTSQMGKTKSKWGGFLKNIYAFDPLFFKISPAEAERLDPQEKLFLQTAWHTIEDAGYTREKLNALSEGHVGVYVGSMYQEYQLFNSEQALLGNPIVVGGSAASIANRVSYFLNLKGPSLTLDTMCSSALTSIYLACQDLVKGKCKMAIAGGVNVSVHPNKYLILSYENFLSSDGLCKSFGAGGDGYVPAEGVGAVLLKPLSSAIKDGDLVYGVIKGVDINHGGKAAGFTVPSANAQAEVIRSVIEQSRLSQGEISYIEAHGTGTSLGDPIEIAGLNQSFDPSKMTKKIAVGSIKSNIGHCESAAGIASVTKVLLQMKHKTLVPSIHSEPANPYIDFENIPLRVQTELAPWDEEKRIALISSFGAGGSNAGLIIEEFERQPLSKEQKMSKLFVLSAQQRDRLDVYAKKILQFFEKQNRQTFSLSSCIYTLQIGREAFKERIAIVFETLDDLMEKLNIFLDKKSHPDIFLSLRDSLNDMIEMSGIQEEFKEFVSTFSPSYSPKIIGKLWAQNIKIDWNALYEAPYPQMMSLPTYPFAEIPCFIKRVSLSEKNDIHKKLHPLIHENTSNFNRHQFTSLFTQEEPLLRDHVIQGEMIFPGAAIAEMFLSATQILSGAVTHYCLEDLFWLQPLRMKDQLSIYTVLKVDKNVISAQLLDQFNNCMSQCTLSPITPSDFNPQRFFVVEALKSEMEHHIVHNDIYEHFKTIGFQFGKTFKTIAEINFSDDAFIAKIELHSETARYSSCHIQPYLLDAMLQATIVFSMGNESTLPFYIKKLIYSHSNQEARWIYGLKKDKNEKNSIYDIFLLDEQGQVILSLYGFHDAPINVVKENKQDSIDEVLELMKMNSLTVEETENALLVLLGKG